MRKKKVFALALSMMAMTSVNAGGATKSVQVPFVNEMINSTSYEGLAVGYDMNGQPLQRVVCVFYNLYKGWVDYTDNGAVNHSRTYGDKQIVMLTSAGQTRDVTDTIDQLHADRQGALWIYHTDEESKTLSPATVSCFYMADDGGDGR